MAKVIFTKNGTGVGPKQRFSNSPVDDTEANRASRILETMKRRGENINQELTMAQYARNMRRAPKAVMDELDPLTNSVNRVLDAETLKAQRKARGKAIAPRGGKPMKGS